MGDLLDGACKGQPTFYFNIYVALDTGIHLIGLILDPPHQNQNVALCRRSCSLVLSYLIRWDCFNIYGKKFSRILDSLLSLGFTILIVGISGVVTCLQNKK